MLLFCCLLTFGHPMQQGQWVDLTHNFDEHTIYWPTAKTFQLETEFKGETEKGYHYEANRFSASEHGGTHLDAPIHFADKKHTVDEIPLNHLMGEGIVIDVAAQCKNRDYEVSVQDFLNWEKEHGTIPKGAIVLLNTGSAKDWKDRKKYMGTDQRGAESVKDLHFPGLAPKAAQWLVDHREIVAIGLDTPSIDYGQSKLFESHQILFKENIPAFENVANLNALPPKGSWVIALPMKIKGGSGGPLRIIAQIPK